MVVIFERDETEGLKNPIRHVTHRAEDFGHAVYWSGLGLKRNFDEVALSQRLRDAQQSSGDGDGLEFRFGAAAVFEPDGSQDGIS